MTDDPFFSKLPKSFDVMHWHDDMSGIPRDGILLAKSEGCPHQAFRYGDNVYGFQFHTELTLSVIEETIEKCRGDLEPGKFVRTKEEMLHSNYNGGKCENVCIFGLINTDRWIFIPHILIVQTSRFPDEPQYRMLV